MIARIWRSGLDASRRDEYERFAAERSLPMFQRRHGCLGVLFGAGEEECVVVSLWTDRDAVDRLEVDPEYRATVDAIVAAGFLRPPRAVELVEASSAWVAPGLADEG